MVNCSNLIFTSLFETPLGCVDKFNLLAITSAVTNAQTDGTHSLEVTANGEVRSIDICGRGTICSSSDVDYYTLDIERFGFSSSCIRKEDFEGAKLKQMSNDGWNVGSVYLFVDTCETHELLTADPKFDKWIDGDGDANNHEHSLTKV